MIFGRSDGVLNPQGVRFGTSELYAVVEEMKSDVDDCIAVAQKTPDGDERVYVFSPLFFYLGSSISSLWFG